MMSGLPGGLMEWSAGGLSVGLGLYAARMIGGGCKWLVVYFTGRIDQKEEAIEKRGEKVDAVTQRMFDRMEGQIESLTTRLEKAEIKLEHCEQQHAEAREEASKARAEVMELQSILQGKGKAAELAQLIIAAEKKEAKA